MNSLPISQAAHDRRNIGFHRHRPIPGRSSAVLRRTRRPAGRSEAVEPAYGPRGLAAGASDGSHARQIPGTGTAHVRAGAPRRGKRGHRQPFPRLDPAIAAHARARRDPVGRGRRPRRAFHRAARHLAPVETGARARRLLVHERRLRRRAPVRQQPARAVLRPEQGVRSGRLAGRGRRALDRPAAAARERQRLRPARARLARSGTLQRRDGDGRPNRSLHLAVLSLLC